MVTGIGFKVKYVCTETAVEHPNTHPLCLFEKTDSIPFSETRDAWTYIPNANMDYELSTFSDGHPRTAIF